MKIVFAKIVDSTHLELSQSIKGKTGETITISIPETDDEMKIWKEASKKKFLESYDEEDAVYDNL